MYYNAKSGNCYKGKNNSLVECDFSNSGLKNTKTRELIQDVVWNLGGVKGYVQDSNGLAKHWYNMERGTDVYTGRPTTWMGKIALMYLVIMLMLHLAVLKKEEVSV